MIVSNLKGVSLKRKTSVKEEENNNKNIIIVDEIMGSGKTFDAIEIMKFLNETGQKYIYVTPYRNEIYRVINNVGNERLVTPQITNEYKDMHSYIDVEEGLENGYSFEFANINEFNKKTLMHNFINLVHEGKNIATTHHLFLLIKESYADLFKDYYLILDEVVEVVSSHIIKPVDFSKFINDTDLIQVDDVSKKVVYYMEDYSEDHYKKPIDFCRRENVYVQGTALISIFSIDIFKSFKQVQIFTYMFEGSILAAYFKMYHLKYAHIISLDQERAKLQQIVDNKLLKIYEGPKNFSKKHKMTILSYSSFNDFRAEYKTQIKKGFTNLCRTKFDTKSKYNAYTTYKDQRECLSGVRYSLNFIPANSRATNDYQNIKSIGYFLNRYLNPGIVNFFKSNGVDIDQDKWALSELIQLLWRGCIRKGEPMNVYIPSYRMRTLLIDYINGGTIDSFKMKDVA